MTAKTVAVMLLCAAAFAQDTRITGPNSGFVFDSQTQELRPIRGIVGAAYLAAPVLSGADAASVSPDGVFAVASRGGQLELIRNVDSDSPQSQALGEAPGDSLDFSWSEDAVAVVSRAARQAQVWNKIHSAPALAASYDLSSIRGEIRAVLFDGERIAIAAKGGVYLAASGSVQLLAELDSPAGLARDGGDLYVANAAANEIWQIHDYASSAAPMLFAGERDGVSTPVGVQVSRRRLLVASAESRSVTAFDLASRQAVGRVDLEFSPTRLEALGSRPLALLNQPASGEPLWVLDTGDAFAAYFVPAGREQ
jgi:hypothetical protein